MINRRERELDALAVRFAGTLSAQTRAEAYEDCPEAVYYLCAAWAQDTVESWSWLKRRAIVGDVPKESVSYLAKEALTDAAWEKVTTLYGDPERKPIAETPSELRIYTAVHPAGMPDLDWPDRRSRRSLPIAMISFYDDAHVIWVWLYYLSTDRSGKNWILWAEASYGEDVELEIRARPVACCNRRDVAEQDAALYLLRAYWGALIDNIELQSPDQLRWCGTIEEASFYGLYHELWSCSD